MIFTCVQQLRSAPRARYCRGMVVRFALLICVSILLLGRGVPPAYGGEAQDLRVEQGVTLYDAKKYAAAKTILLPLAEAGHPKAMNMIGLMNKFGQGFPENREIGCDWYERAANAGYAKSMYNMSICYDGVGRPKDPEMDKQWLLKAAEHGITDAMINLAWQNQTADDEYRYWMNMAAKHGSSYARTSLWLQGYKGDVPDITARDIVCVSVRILIFDEHFDVCD